MEYRNKMHITTEGMESMKIERHTIERETKHQLAAKIIMDMEFAHLEKLFEFIKYDPFTQENKKMIEELMSGKRAFSENVQTRIYEQHLIDLYRTGVVEFEAKINV